MSPENARTELQSLCEWYNSEKGEPGADPYRLAAELQQRFTSIHPWNDYNGRCSRLLMNWSLKRHGLPPSAPNDFNNDLFSTPKQWTEELGPAASYFANAQTDSRGWETLLTRSRYSAWRRSITSTLSSDGLQRPSHPAQDTTSQNFASIWIFYVAAPHSLTLRDETPASPVLDPATGVRPRVSVDWPHSAAWERLP
ncbi:Fic family protein [Nocardia sp. NPDC057668]|uniref:Fic family protein n=1 Tax=Nocardia sp. NPDC057668 TaxID=3346202 RepID=UPI003672331F